MGLRWKMGSLLAVCWVILMEGAAILAAQECTNGRYRMNINGLSICCPPCRQSENFQVCPDVEERQIECRCNPGFGCRTKSCTTCEKLPTCDRKSYLRRSEKVTTVYEYRCENCPEGSYFDAESGTCKKTPTTESGRNRSMSSVPSTPSTKLTPNNASEPFLNNWVSVVLFFGVAFVIILLVTIIIHIYIWKLKAAPLSKMTGDPFHPHPVVHRNTKEDMDSLSCQYPEEEHGEHGNCLGEKQNV